MTRTFVLAAAALALGACAHLDDPDAKLARADCKIAPLTLASATGGKPRQVDPLEQRYAEMQLASSEYRWRSYGRNGPFNNVEDALRDCSNAR